MKKIIIIFSIIFFCPRSYILANLEINEIMYDLKTGSDEGREWVEIYNNSNTPVDLSAFRFFEADTNHKIKLMQGSANVAGRGYAIIVSDLTKFKIDWPNFTGTIYDSSFSLSNSGETLAIKNILPDGSLNVKKIKLHMFHRLYQKLNQLRFNPNLNSTRFRKQIPHQKQPPPRPLIRYKKIKQIHLSQQPF